MDDRRATTRALRLVPPFLILLWSLPHFNQGDWRVDIGWYSALGLQAWRTGDLWTLSSQPGIPYFNKPPLVLWIHGFFLWILGPELWAARLGSLLAACLAVVGVGAIARRWAGEWAAFVAALALATTPEVFRRTREVSMDLWLLAFLALAGAFATRPGLRAAAGAGAMLGLALLCKPLVALLAVPLLAAWPPPVDAGSPARRTGAWAARAGTMLLVAACVAAPWHLSMLATHETFAREYFGAEIAARASGDLVDPERADRGPFFYLGHFLRTAWPWLPVVLAAAWLARRPSPLRRPLMLAWAWILLWTLAISAFEDRRPRYAMPVYLGSALAIGLAAASLPRARIDSLSRTAWRLGLPLASAASILAAILPLRIHRPPDPQWAALFDWIRRERITALWGGALQGPRAARLYLHLGWWPDATHNRWGDLLADPQPGDLVLYHDRDGRAPGEGESVVFTSGRLTVTSLTDGPWSPRAIPDPGE